MLSVESGKKCGKRGSMDLLIDLQQLLTRWLTFIVSCWR